MTGDLHSGLTPLVVVHGGPGCSHDYLENLEDLAQNGRAVIHYDQVGGGRSTLLPTKGGKFWTVDLFLRELDNLLDGLDLRDDYHLLGQSWGGMLAAEHAVRQPIGLSSLILSNSPASMVLWSSEAKVLRAKMDPAVAEILDCHEARGTTSDPEYVEATQVYYDEHVCRVVPNPPELVRTTKFMARDSTVYHVMNGPNEFRCVGTLGTGRSKIGLTTFPCRRCFFRVVTMKRRRAPCNLSTTRFPEHGGRSSNRRVICRSLRSGNVLSRSLTISFAKRPVRGRPHRR